MSKLHEVLAVLPDLDGAAKKIREEAIVTFSKKANHFMGSHKTLKMFDEGRQAEEAGAEEHKPLVTTVGAKLTYVQESQEKHLDALLQMEATNQQARADLIVENPKTGEQHALAKDLPATFLLGLESRMRSLRAVLETIPTLDPAHEWVKDPSQGDGVYRAAHSATTWKQEKAIRHQVLVQPTKEHPAQIEKWVENITVGTYTTALHSGMFSPGEKSDLLARIDALIKGAKQARQRANATEVQQRREAEKLFNFIFDRG